MLVLSRKENETIVFPELGISIEVVRVKGSVVKVGVKAPDSVRILRGELVESATAFDDPTPLPLCAVAKLPVHDQMQVA